MHNATMQCTVEGKETKRENFCFLKLLFIGVYLLYNAVLVFTVQQSESSLSLFTFLHWRRKRQPTPVFLPGESQGRGSLVGCRLWGRTGLDTTEAT